MIEYQFSYVYDIFNMSARRQSSTSALVHLLPLKTDDRKLKTIPLFAPLLLSAYS